MDTKIINDGSFIRITNDNVPLLINKNHIKTIETVKNEMVKIDIGEGPLKQLYVKFAEVSMPDSLVDVNALRDSIKAMLDSNANTGNTTTVGVSSDLTPLLTLLQAELNKVAEVKVSVEAISQQLTSNSQIEVAAIHELNTNLLALIQLITGSVNNQVQHNSAIIQSVAGINDNITTIAAQQNLVLTDIKLSLNTLALDNTTQNGSIVSLLQQIRNQSQISMALSSPTLQDDTEPNVIYYGYASSASGTPGAVPAISDPLWAIKKVTSDRSGTTNTEWANGNRQFTNIWAQRSVLNYGPAIA